MNEVTVILTCCNRVDLLRKALDSFFKLNTYPIKEFLAHNDGDNRLFSSILRDYPMIKWEFSGSRVGYAESLDKLLKKVKTEYVFTTEEDWYYYRNPGFIERSLKILEENPEIHQVWIRDEGDHGHPLSEEMIVSGFKVKQPLYGYRRFWNGYSLNPALRRMSDIKRFFPNGLVEYRDEADQAKHVHQFNYKALSLVESSIRHIGWGRRSINFRP